MKKRVPSYWWDFGKDGFIIVESDENDFPILGEFEYDVKGYADQAIDQAQNLINDLSSGRITPKECMKNG